MKTWLNKNPSCPVCRRYASLGCVTKVHFHTTDLTNISIMSDTMNEALRESLIESKMIENSESKMKLATLQSQYQELKEAFNDFREQLKKVENVIEKNTDINFNEDLSISTNAAIGTSKPPSLLKRATTAAKINVRPRLSRSNSGSSVMNSSGVGVRPKPSTATATETRASTLRRMHTLCQRLDSTASMATTARPRTAVRSSQNP